MTRRKLTPDEMSLWRTVNARTERIRPNRDPESTPPAPKPRTPKTNPPDDQSPIPAFRLGQNAGAAKGRHDLAKPLADRLAQSPVTMDKKTFGRLKRGKLSPEGRIDLHGMTLAHAHPALIRFILSAHASGKRLVLVITGKGKTASDEGPIPRPRGVLKHQAPEWLRQPPLAQVVLQVSEAHVSHGGSGAYYVYLRRNR